MSMNNCPKCGNKVYFSKSCVVVKCGHCGETFEVQLKKTPDRHRLKVALALLVVLMLFVGDFFLFIWPEFQKAHDEIMRAEDPLYDGTYSYELKDDNCLTNGKDTEAGRELYQDGVSFGPFIKLLEGKYRVIIEGESLGSEAVRHDFWSGEKEREYEEQDLTTTDQRIEFVVQVEETISDAEIRIWNDGENIVIIKGISIIRE